MVLSALVVAAFFYGALGSRLASIVNGNFKATEPDLGEFPFQASLMMKSGSEFRTFCGGSLIHPRWVLTAAHCLEQDGQTFPVKLLYATVGSVYTSGKGGQRIQAERLVINKKYFESGGGYDIGVVKLKSSAKLGKNVKVIKLHSNNQENLIGKTAYLTGFGIINDFYQQPSRMRKAVLHVDNLSKCSIPSGTGYPEICCTSSIKEGKACKGDSGGPLFVISNDKFVQIGITSHLSILPVCRVPFNNSVYTKVAAYISWLAKATGIDFSKYTRN